MSSNFSPRVGPQPLRIFSSSGRIGRLRYLAYLTASWIVASLYNVVVGFMAVTTQNPFWGAQSLLIVVSLLASLLWGVRRAHDMGWSGWSCLLMIVPFVALVWFFKPGTHGVNRFGEPPPPNTVGVKLLGCIAPLIFISGIGAAVAIPAYQLHQHHVGPARSGWV